MSSWWYGMLKEFDQDNDGSWSVKEFFHKRQSTNNFDPTEDVDNIGWSDIDMRQLASPGAILADLAEMIKHCENNCAYVSVNGKLRLATDEDKK